MKGKLKQDSFKLYSKLTVKRGLFVLGNSLTLILLTVIGIALGPANLSISEVLSAILFRLVPCFKPDESIVAIIWSIRLPRIVMAIVCGMGLALAGVALQAILHNPLVSPYTLGVSSAAGFGAALIISMGLIAPFSGLANVLKIGGIIVSAFAWALVALLLVYSIGRIKGMSSGALILAGMAVSYTFNALLSIIQYFSSEQALAMIVFWLMGSLDKADWSSIVASAAITFTIFPLIWKYSWDLNAMSLGDETAASLGVDVKKVRGLEIVLACVVTASVICFTGTIGFVGLIAPHIARMIIGGDHRFLIPASTITGANLLLAAEILARIAVSPIVLPIGAVTSLMGIPVFIYLVLKRREEFW